MEFKENVIEFITGNGRATMTFTRPKFINRIRKLKKRYPDEVEIISDEGSCLTAHVPVKWIHIYRSPQMSNEMKKIFAQRGRERFEKMRREKQAAEKNTLDITSSGDNKA